MFHLAGNCKLTEFKNLLYEKLRMTQKPFDTAIGVFYRSRHPRRGREHPR